MATTPRGWDPLQFTYFDSRGKQGPNVSAIRQTTPDPYDERLKGWSSQVGGQQPGAGGVYQNHGNPPQPDWSVSRITTNQPLADAYKGVFERSLGQIAFPDFNPGKTTANLNRATEGVSGAYDRYASELGNTQGYEDSMRKYAGDLGSLANAYEGRLGGIDQRYGDIVDTYQERGLGALNSQLANNDRYQQEMQRMADLASGRVEKNFNLNSMARIGTGGPSGINRNQMAQFGRDIYEASTPFIARGVEDRGGILQQFDPYYRNVAGMGTRYADSSLGMQQDIYGKQAGAMGTSNEIEGLIRNLRVQAASGGWEAAMRNLQSVGLPMEVVDNIRKRLLSETSAEYSNLAQFGAGSPLYEDVALRYNPGTYGYSPNYGGFGDRYGGGGGMSNDVMPNYVASAPQQSAYGGVPYRPLPVGPNYNLPGMVNTQPLGPYGNRYGNQWNVDQIFGPNPYLATDAPPATIG